MFRITMRNILSRKLRTLATSLAVALGVAFVAGSLIFGSTITRTFDGLFASIYDKTDVVIRGPELVKMQNGFSGRAAFPDSTVEKVRAMPEVKYAEPYLDGFAQIVDRNGKALSTTGAPQSVDVWDGNSTISPWKLAEGRAPKQANEIALDKATAKMSKYKLGDKVTVLSASGSREFDFVGTVRFGSLDSPLTAQFVITPKLSVAQELVDMPNMITQIGVVATPGVSQDQLAQKLKAALATQSSEDQLDVVSGKAIIKESQSTLRKSIAPFTIFLSAFAGIALFVGAFIINNTFGILLAQRARENAMLRAIGARRGQIFRSAILEAFVVGLISSALGLLLGIALAAGLKGLLSAFGVDIPASGISVPMSAVWVSLLAGVLLTMVAAILPSLRSSRVPPLAALRDMAFDTSHRSKKRAATAMVLLAGGISLVAISLFGDVAKPFIYAIAGTAFIFLAMAAFGPFLVGLAVWVFGWPMRRLGRITGKMASENAARNPGRTAATASALMIGVAIVVLVAMFVSSAKASLFDQVDKALGADYAVSFASQVPGATVGGVSTQLSSELRKQPEVKAVVQERPLYATVDGKYTYLGVVSVRDVDAIMNLDVKSGDLKKMSETDIAISQKVADDHKLKLGSVVKIQMQQGPSRDFHVAAIYENANIFGGYIVPLEATTSVGISELDMRLYVARAQGVSLEAGLAVVKRVAEPYKSVEVQDRSQLKKSYGDQIDKQLGLFMGLLGLTILIALFGIANTLALSVFERTREIGLMRAVGASRRQVRSVVRREAIIVTLLGVVQGIVIGLLLAWAVLHAFKSEGLTVIAVPWITLFIIVALAFVAATLAAIFPARRAARLNILKAVSFE